MSEINLTTPDALLAITRSADLDETISVENVLDGCLRSALDREDHHIVYYRNSIEENMSAIEDQLKSQGFKIVFDVGEGISCMTVLWS